MYNLLIGGAAGQGIETTAAVLEKTLKRSGYSVFTMRDFMSRVRGGHNFSTIRFGTEVVRSHSDQLDGIIALNEETVRLHRDKLNETGFILCDTKLAIDDPRAIQLPMAEMARTIGNPNVTGSIAVGAILKLFATGLDLVEPVLRESVKEQYIPVNIQALQEGFNAVEERFPHLEGPFADWMILSGNKALALGALAAGLKFYSAYPMSPSTSIMEYLAEKSGPAEIVVEQAEDEIAGINMAIGASFAGARAMTGTSGGGFSLKVEALGLAGMMEIPLVVVDAQRPGPVTGLPTRTEQSDLKFVISASQGEFPRMVIGLRHHADAFTQTVRALNLAEKYQIPIIILTDQYLADASATVAPFEWEKIERVEPADPSGIKGEYLRYRFTDDGISPRLLPGQSEHLVIVDSDEHDERGWITESADMRQRMMDKRMKKLEKLKEELLEPDFIGAEDFETLLIGWGSTYGPTEEAVKLLNEGKGTAAGKTAALVFGDVFPLPERLLRKHAAQAKRIINIEQNATGQLAGLIRETTGITVSANILKYDGRQIMAREIVQGVLAEVKK